jgi:diguanylate cyclase (GGDEF)-like protein
MSTEGFTPGGTSTIAVGVGSPAGAAPDASPRTGGRLGRLTTHRQVGALLALVLVLALVVASVGYLRFTDVKGELDRAKNQFEPAERALVIALDHWGKAIQAFSGIASGDAADPALAATFLKEQGDANTAFGLYEKAAVGVPGEKRLHGEYAKAMQTFNTAITQLTDSTQVFAAGFLTKIVPLASAVQTPMAALRRLYGSAINAAVDAAHHDIAVTERDTGIAGAFMLLAAVVTAGFVLQAIRQREREIAARDRERARQTRRGEIETRLQRGLELTQTEGASYELIKKAIALAAPHSPAELLVADSSRAHFRQAATTRVDTPGCAVSAPKECPATTRGQSQVWASSTDLDACPHLEASTDKGCSAVCVPVSIAGKTVGVVHVTGPDHQPPERNVIEDLELVARKSGERIGMLRAFARSETQAHTDALTGLLNRRSLESQLTALTEEGGSYVVAFGDLDHFKILNDVHGHDTGDRALRLFARVLRDNVRPNDIAARYGGEEFVIILPDCPVADAYAVLERVRERLAANLHDGTVPSFTVSFGLAESTSDKTFAEVIASADAALLHAKRSGRNRIVTEADVCGSESQLGFPETPEPLPSSSADHEAGSSPDPRIQPRDSGRA